VAVTRGKVVLDIKFHGAASTGKAASDAEKDIKRVQSASDGAGNSLRVSLGGASEEAFGKFSTAIGGGVAKLGFFADGVMAAVDAVSALGERLVEAAARADQMDALRNSIRGVDQVIKEAQERSAGFFSKEEIAKLVAEFQTFDIVAEDLGGTLREVAATSVRLGRDAGDLIDQVTEGVSKQSALRLDNAGVIVVAADAEAAYAEKLGTTVELLDEGQKRTALLSEVTAKMAEKNRSIISLEQTRTGVLKKLSSSWDDFTAGIETWVADQAVAFIDVVSDSAIGLNDFERTVEKVSRGVAVELRNQRNAFMSFFADIRKNAELTKRTLRELDKLGAETKKKASDKEEALQIEQNARNVAFVEAQAEAAEKLMDLAAKEEGTIAGIAFRDLVSASSLLIGDRDFKALHDIEDEKKAVMEGVAKRAEELAEAQIKRDIAAFKSRRKATHLLEKELEGLEEEARLILEEHDLIKAGSALRLLQVQNAKKLSKARRQLAAVEGTSDRAVKKRIKFQVRVNDLEREKNQLALDGVAATRGGGGGGSARVEEAQALAVTEADRLNLAAAQLKARGDMDDATQRELVALSESLAVQKAMVAFESGRITSARLRHDIQLAEVEAGGKLLRLDEARAKAAKRRRQEELDDIQRLKDERRSVRESLGVGESEIEKQLERIDKAEEKGHIQADEAARLRVLAKLEDGYSKVADAAEMAAAAQNKGAAAMGRMVQAIQSNAKALSEGGAGAIAASGNIAAALVDDEKSIAIIKAISATAAGFFALGHGDLRGAAAYFTSAAMYGIVAGTTPSRAAGGGGGGGGGGSRARSRALERPEDRQGGGATILVFNQPVVGGTAQQIGATLDGFVQSTRGTGRASARM